MTGMRKWSEKVFSILNRNGRLVRNQVRMDLERLHPGNRGEELCKEYYCKKIEKTGAITLVVLLITLALTLRALLMKEDLSKGVARSDIYGKDQSITLEGTWNGHKELFQMTIHNRKLSTEEIEAYDKDFCEHMGDLVLGDNQSFDRIEYPLVLQDSYAEYPFGVEWQSKNVDVISATGDVHPTQETERVELVASLSYENWETEHVIELSVVAQPPIEPTPFLTVQDMLEQSELASINEEYWILPDAIDQQPIFWQKKSDFYAGYVFAAGLGLALTIFFLSDRDLHDLFEKKRQRLKQEYPDIVYKLALYLGAGMTLQRAFQKIGPDYEQVLYTCRELQSGVAEALAYEQFGKRSGLQEYVRLSTLMTQNLKKGNAALLQRLREEADKALIEKIQMGRKLGEEASSKLLLPMVMMLAVVMIMVIMPAFSSVGV